MSSECAFNIYNAVVNLAGVTLGGVIGFFSARYISKNDAIAVALAKLRAAFAPSLCQLDLGRMNNCPDDHLLLNFLKEELPKLAIAIEEYKYFVHASDRVAYQEVWKNYVKTINAGGVVIVRAFNEDDPWSIIETKIRNLTTFPETKLAIDCDSPEKQSWMLFTKP